MIHSHGSQSVHSSHLILHNSLENTFQFTHTNSIQYNYEGVKANKFAIHSHKLDRARLFFTGWVVQFAIAAE